MEEQILAKKWFYVFELPSGRKTTCYLPESVVAIHPTRLQMLFSVLDPLFESQWSSITALDLATHQGFFATALAKKGCADVLGIDARPEHIADAQLIRDVYRLDRLRFQERDLFQLRSDELGSFDIVLMLGLLYHLENPIGALRIAHSLTKQVCLIETQIIPHLEGVTDWGSYQFSKKIIGCWGLIDETEETHGPESGITGFCLCPSLPTLLWVMRKLGFAHVEVVSPGENSYEQFAYGKRVMIAGYVK